MLKKIVQVYVEQNPTVPLILNVRFTVPENVQFVDRRI